MKKKFYSYYIPTCRTCSEERVASGDGCFDRCSYWKRVKRLSDIPDKLRESKQYRTHFEVWN